MISICEKAAISAVLTSSTKGELSALDAALAKSAQACWDGACNKTAIVYHLAESIRMPGFHWEHPCVPIIAGQLAFLCGLACGPQPEHWARWEAWKEEKGL